MRTINIAGHELKSGDPLRLFVRGFFRDHLGHSKIVAHTLADLFMERWKTAVEDGTMKRYIEQHDDVHTLAATFDREAVTMTDAVLGITKKMKAEAQKSELTFPDRPVFDPTARIFSAGR